VLSAAEYIAHSEMGTTTILNEISVIIIRYLLFKYFWIIMSGDELR
jgi:hypothetical protein